MQKLSIYVGQEQGVGGQGGWGYMEIFKTGANTYMAVCRGEGCMYLQLGGRGRSQGGYLNMKLKYV